MQGVQLAKAMGPHTIAIDTGEEKRKLCIETAGAEHFIDFKKVDDVAKEVVRIRDEIGAHGVFVTAVQAYPSSLSYLGGRIRGRVMCIGMAAAGVYHIDLEP
ncbi:hypothetical protein EJ02DRAFT_458900 [Clathrospora elynae]|uniref:Alcohol dehydrogenase-like C-terminal domain-containing protein n=1 Tax=Clathrospora elynae TaxID=706981 RepID=A0A6A5SBW0_9PLEO|nr:hypothetical protein EJ02DRAFT_458900 [Clathrospora elynae]